MASVHSSAGILLVKMVADGVVAGAIGVIASVFACMWLCKCNEPKPRKRRRETIRPRRWCPRGCWSFSAAQAPSELPSKPQGWEVTSVDSDPRAHATVHAVIAGWDCSALRGQVDVIWASPPCTMYSVARRGSTDEERAASDKLVRRALEIVEALENQPLFIEKPWHEG